MEQIYNNRICVSAFRWAEHPSLPCLTHLSLPTFPFLTLPFTLIPFYWILTDIPSANLTQAHAQLGRKIVVQVPRKRKKFPVPREKDYSCTKCTKCSGYHGVHQPLTWHIGRDSGVGTSRSHFTDPTSLVGPQGVGTVQELKQSLRKGKTPTSRHQKQAVPARDTARL